MALASLRTHTDAVLAVLEATGVAVGDGDEPAGIGWQGAAGQSEFVPYMILYPLQGGTFDGPTAAPDDDIEAPYQITCVGASRQQCEWVADKALTALLTPDAVTITGRSVQRVIPDGGGGARRDDTVQPPVFISTPRFRLWTAPA